jgi:hypothetical protein
LKLICAGLDTPSRVPRTRDRRGSGGYLGYRRLERAANSLELLDAERVGGWKPSASAHDRAARSHHSIRGEHVMPRLNKWSRKRLVFLRKLILRNNVALASFPRSGNTWLSKLLEALSGQQAGSIYRDHVFPRPATGIVIKTHKCDGQRFNRIVHLVRSPLDSISSHFDYMHRYFPQRAQDWGPHVATQTQEWKRHTAYWMEQTKPRITVRYEDLIAEPFAELRKLAQFLHLDVDEDKIEQAVEACKIDRLREASSKRGEDAAGFFRKGGSGHGINRYSADEIATIEAELGELMAKFGYEIPSRI